MYGSTVRMLNAGLNLMGQRAALEPLLIWVKSSHRGWFRHFRAWVVGFNRAEGTSWV